MIKDLDRILGSVYTVNSVPSSNGDGAGVLKYTTIGRFLYWVNSFFIIKDDSKDIIQFYVGNHNYDTKPDDNRDGYVNRNPFLTFEDHFALNLNKFILPKPNTTERVVSFNIKYAEDPILREIIFGKGNDLLDILINIQYIQDVYESVIDSNNPGSINVYDFVKIITEDLNKELGLINSIDLHLEKDSIYHIVDRAVVLGEKEVSRAVIDLAGLNSFVTNVNISSRLTNDLATFATVSAAASRTDVPVENTAMQQWNQNLKDRIIVEKKISKSPEKDVRNKCLALLGYCSFINKDLQRLPSVSKGSLEASHKAIMREFIYDISLESKQNAPGIIPIELSFDIKGISGFKIGQAFTIQEGILPPSYDGKVGFIITQISDKVENNEWITSINTVMQMLPAVPNLRGPNEKSIFDILSGEDLAADVEKLREDLKQELIVEEAAAVDPDANDTLFFNELAKRTVEPTQNDFTPSWSGFRAANDGEYKTSPSGNVELRYQNQSGARKGILHPFLVDQLLKVADYVNSNIVTGAENLAGTNNLIGSLLVTSGGQISNATLDRLKVAQKDRSRVRYKGLSQNESRNHDNGWAADIKIKGRKGEFGQDHPTVKAFTKEFFRRIAANYRAPRVGVSYIIGGAANHYGLYQKLSEAGNLAANIWGKGGFKGAPNWAKSIYKDVREKYKNNNKSLIDRA